jgi:hypothetical protein
MPPVEDPKTISISPGYQGRFPSYQSEGITHIPRQVSNSYSFQECTSAINQFLGVLMLSAHMFHANLAGIHGTFDLGSIPGFVGFAISRP